MNINVEYKDTTGAVDNRFYSMTRLAFAKHMAVAGQGYAPKPQKLLRSIGMFFHYSYYMQRQAFYNDSFSEPPRPLSDPTEKGQFSNLAGKAIADFLSKRIGNSLYTVNYEAVMRLQGHPLLGQRPDLVAYSPTSMFAIEAKGRHQHNPGNMTRHKAQAQAGPINVNYSVACVSYDLFNQVKCNYHDPYNDNIAYDNVSLQAMTRNYYKGLAEFLDLKNFGYSEFDIQGERFYEIDIFDWIAKQFEKEDFPYFPFLHWRDWREELHYFSPKLILPASIRQFAESGITNETKPFIYEATEHNENSNLYIDNDRVGLSIARR